MTSYSRFASLALALVVSFLLSTSASAAVTGFTATITAFAGTGAGLPTTATATNTACPFDGGVGDNFCTTASGHMVSYSSTGFTLGSGVFVVNQFNPSATNYGGTVPLPTTPGQIYVLGTIVNQFSQAGIVTATGGPGGGFGGAIGSGSSLNILLGINPLPNIFGNLILPINAGVTTTVTAMANILGNPVTVTVGGLGWTTGTITSHNGNLGTTNTGVPITNPFITSGSAVGTNNLSSTSGGGGKITLVAPITIKIPGTGADLRAGYSILQITFIPEPGTLLLLGASVAGLVAIGRRSNA